MKIIFNIIIIITLTYAEIEVPQTNATISTAETNSSQINNKDLIAEGGVIKNVISPLQPRGREGFTQVPINTTAKSVIKPIIEPPQTTKPIETLTNVTVTKNEHKSIGRKGVDFNRDVSTNATVKPKKPTITTHGDEPFAPSHFESNKSNSSSKVIPQVPPVDIFNNNQDNTQKYIVPIIIVILSVPFVAILISIVYKRGSEWWKYRHYRRMDFLINGMYDN